MKDRKTGAAWAVRRLLRDGGLQDPGCTLAAAIGVPKSWAAEGLAKITAKASPDATPLSLRPRCAQQRLHSVHLFPVVNHKLT